MAGQMENDKNKYAHLGRLSTEALEELLRADIESPNDDNDEAIAYILEVIEQREQKTPTGRLSDVDTAWEDFQKYYNVPEGEGLSLYPDEEDEDSARPVIGAPRRFRMRRVLIAAAIAACLVVFAMPTALGYQNFIQMVGQWTADVFHFGANSEYSVPTPGLEKDAIQHPGEYEDLQLALDSYEITEAVVPTEITEGFLPVSITAVESLEFGTVDIRAFYENNAGNTISISITKRDSGGSLSYEKDDTSVTPYVAGEITHYVFENNGQTVATWYIGTLECSIKADVPSAKVKKMIDSIYER